MAERAVCFHVPPQVMFHKNVLIPATLRDGCAKRWAEHLSSHPGQPAWTVNYLEKYPPKLSSRRSLTVVEHAALMKVDVAGSSSRELQRWFPRDCLLTFEFVRMTDETRYVRMCLSCLYEDNFWGVRTGVHITGRRRFVDKPKEALAVVQNAESWCSLCRRVPLFDMHDLTAPDALDSPRVEYTFFSRLRENALSPAHTSDRMFSLPLLPSRARPDEDDDAEVPDNDVADADMEFDYEDDSEEEDVHREIFGEDDVERAMWDEVVNVFFGGDEFPNPITPPPSPVEEPWD